MVAERRYERKWMIKESHEMATRGILILEIFSELRSAVRVLI